MGCAGNISVHFSNQIVNFRISMADGFRVFAPPSLVKAFMFVGLSIRSGPSSLAQNRSTNEFVKIRKEIQDRTALIADKFIRSRHEILKSTLPFGQFDLAVFREKK